ncbi:MAG TPA: FKBP-type peptidyl-prolyl cis-trans isomerase [Pirellulaceae bacterium]|nr:FKBP-type peptidyl-prolyl cis-trans isomerase [Pirellulaceae bacterium]HMO91941.1 FKBP-type peptidyl-prolyl cis-trans isomerase [Pirellulaceae bacterium]HMP68740.1 FKBP-type peptidyl-prolyl cis-trans isomerase [Pirellulaceae bacterium]
MNTYKFQLSRQAALVLLATVFPLVHVAAQEGFDEALVKKSSYIIGYNMAQNIISQGVELDRESFFRGLTAALQDEEFQMSDEEVETTMKAFQQYTEKRALDRMRREGEENKTAGEAFQAEFRAKEGVKELEDGLLYQVLASGGGMSPTATNTVRIHYHGTFTNGKVFDSSVERKQPAEFPVNGVVPGFSAALQAMKVGDKWRVVIPSHLAYGPQGRPPIGPNRTLIFEIELLEIVK